MRRAEILRSCSVFVLRWLRPKTNWPCSCDRKVAQSDAIPGGGLQLDGARCTLRWRRTAAGVTAVGGERVSRFCESPGLRAGPSAHPRSAQPERGRELGRVLATHWVAGPVAQARSASGGWATGRTDGELSGAFAARKVPAPRRSPLLEQNPPGDFQGGCESPLNVLFAYFLPHSRK